MWQSRGTDSFLEPPMDVGGTAAFCRGDWYLVKRDPEVKILDININNDEFSHWPLTL